MVQNVQYLNGHVTLPFEYWTLILSSIQMNPVFRCLVFRWLLYLNAIWIPQQPDHLNTRQMDAIFLYWPGILMVILVHRKKAPRPTIWNLTFKKFGIQMFLVFKWYFTSSTITCVRVPRALASPPMSDLSRTPLVQNVKRVFGETRDSSRIW